jgi:hypothetical protein
MKDFFQKLFNLGLSESNQTQREALIELWLLGMYADTLVSIPEQAFLAETSTELKWESGVSFSSYLQRTIPKVRSAKDDAQKTKTLLKDIDQRLGSDEFKRKAIEDLERLLATDGVVKLEEDFLAQVKIVMGI